MKPMKLRFVVGLAILAIFLNGYSLSWWHKYFNNEEKESAVQLTEDPKKMSELDVTFDEDSELSTNFNYINAANAFKRKDFLTSINELNSDIEKSPNHAQSFFLLGKVYEVAIFPDGQYFSRMAKNYEKYIELKPNGYRVDYAKLKSAQYFISIGLNQQNTELLDKAEMYLKSLDQNNNDVRMALGAIYLDRESFGQAIAEFEKSANLQPNELRLKYNSLGLAYIKTRKYGNAENVLKIAIQIEPDNKFAHNNLGFVYLQLRKFKEAKLEFQEALKIDPSYKNAQDNLDWLNSPYAK